MSLEDWNRKLAAVKVRKQDMNNLIMNYLVTEVCGTLLIPGCSWHKLCWQNWKSTGMSANTAHQSAAQETC